MIRKNHKVELIKVWLAVSLCIFGMILITFAFFVDPTGIIHQSVLIAFGESLTFSSAILGINYLYQNKVKDIEYNINEKINNYIEKGNKIEVK